MIKLAITDKNITSPAGGESELHFVDLRNRPVLGISYALVMRLITQFTQRPGITITVQFDTMAVENDRIALR
jgi:hypothetical protein